RSQDPAALLLAEEIDEGLLHSIRALPSAYRACVQLLEHEHTYEEIARKLDCPVGTIRSRVHRARAHLRRALASQPEPLSSLQNYCYSAQRLDTGARSVEMLSRLAELAGAGGGGQVAHRIILEEGDVTMTRLILPVGKRDHTLGKEKAALTLVAYGHY